MSVLLISKEFNLLFFSRYINEPLKRLYLFCNTFPLNELPIFNLRKLAIFLKGSSSPSEKLLRLMSKSRLSKLSKDFKNSRLVKRLSRTFNFFILGQFSITNSVSPQSQRVHSCN